MKRISYVVVLVLVNFMTILIGCTKAPTVDGTFDFVIYESDEDNSNLTDNKVVARYTIEYKNCKTVTDALIKKGNKYYFTNDSEDYLILEDSAYGLSYTYGYFANYFECSGGIAIDVSMSYTAVNGQSAPKGIGKTPLEGLKEYGFVINAWA